MDRRTIEQNNAVCFLWVVSWRLNFMYRRFGTVCSIFIGGVNKKNILLVHTTYEDGTVCSEMSTHKIQTQGNHPKIKNTTFPTRRKFEIKIFLCAYMYLVIRDRKFGIRMPKGVRNFSLFQ